jgi:hypothetical protein
MSSAPKGKSPALNHSDPYFSPKYVPKEAPSGSHTGTTAGISVGGVVVVAIVILLLCWCKRRKTSAVDLELGLKYAPIVQVDNSGPAYDGSFQTWIATRESRPGYPNIPQCLGTNQGTLNQCGWSTQGYSFDTKCGMCPNHCPGCVNHQGLIMSKLEAEGQNPLDYIKHIERMKFGDAWSPWMWG